MNIISRCDNNKISLLTDSSLELLYSKLRVYLSTEQMSFFSRPTVKNNETLWSVDFKGDVRSVSRLDSETRARAAMLIESRRSEIAGIINKDPELLPVLAKLFMVPSENEIFYYFDEKQQLVVVLAQWACSRLDHSSTIDALSFFVGGAVGNRRSVKLHVTYSNGEIAADYPLVFDYFEITRSLRTDLSGNCDLGLLKLGSEFTVSPNTDAGLQRKIFRVSEDQAYYNIVIPRPSTLQISVLGEDGLPATGRFIEYELDGSTGYLVTDSAGNASLTGLEAGKTINIKVQDATQPSVQHLLTADINKLVFKLVNKQETAPTVEPEMPEEVIKPASPPANVRICLVQDKNTPVPDAEIDIHLKSGQITRITESDGSTTIPASNFSEGEKVKLSIVTRAAGKKNAKSGNKFKKSFKYSEENLEYIIMLRKMPNLWWLLLFLLPLLLLVRCEKDVQIRVMNPDGTSPVQDVTVQFGYNRAFLYNEGSFFTSEWISAEGKTGGDGVAVFEKNAYSVYSGSCHHFSESALTARGDCVTSGNLNPYFHNLSGSSPFETRVSPEPVTADFQVLDSADNQPLPGANVLIVTDFSGYIQTDSAQSDANGKLVFSKLPKCGKVLKVVASMDGYQSDTLGMETAEYFMSAGIDVRRTLKLKPVTEKVVFFVTNCTNNQPVPGADITITLEYGNGLKKSQKINTNVNGVGKGAYDNVHIIAEVGLVAEKKYFKQGSLDKKYVVRDFVKLPDSLRTLCLEPESNPIDFVNVDVKANRPVAGVTNVVTIVNGGKETRKETILSNTNGVFTVGGTIPGDNISIHSSYPPNFQDNDYTIKNKDATKLLEASARQRVIPLKPREVDLVFRTVDADSASLISDARLTITVDSSVVAPPNSGSGTFTVKAPYSSIISILAEKSGYEKNDTSIHNKAVSYLVGSKQSVRDISMKKTPQVKVKLTVFNHNKKPDEVFALWVNNVVIDTISHTTEQATRSTFEIAMMPETDNIIELVYIGAIGDKKDTNSRIILQPGNLLGNFKGNDKSYRFRYNAAKNTLSLPEKF